MPFQAQPTEKCTACSRTVYQTEKAIVEEKTDKKVYHKTCIRCATCNKVLEVGQIASMDGKIWCKPHFKQLFATKGNFDEAFGKEKAPVKSPAVSTTPNSFVPETKNETKQQDSKPTSEATIARFRKFREDGDSDRCVSCSKTVYLAEKMLVEDKNEKRLFHKLCFKCSVCSMILDLRNYGSLEGKIYCKNHLKELGKSSSGPSLVITANASFIPQQEEKKVEKAQTPENIASKFKVETEKCKQCSKTVYATEKISVPGKQGGLFHKNCFKCSVCSCILDVSKYGSNDGVLFCGVHLKQFGKPEQAKGDNTYFVSPLASTDPSYTPGPKEDGNVDQYDDREDNKYNQREEERENSRYERNGSEDGSRASVREEEREEEIEPEKQPERKSSFNSGRGSPAIEKNSGRSSPSEPERKSSFRNDSGRNSPTIERDSVRERSSSRETSRSDLGGDDQKRREDERQRKREERQRQIDAEEREQEEEREKRRREREKRLADATDSSTSSPSSSSLETSSSRESDREERRKKREEERRKEEEDREREEEKRKREREARKKEQEEEAVREQAEQEKKAEERRRRLAELKANV